jgi:dTDP-glucose pyrophosphorylase
MILVYLCGGIGSRFEGGIKQFAKIGPNGESLIEYSINQALKALNVGNIRKIIFIVSVNTIGPFMNFFGDTYKGIPIEYINQIYDTKQRTKPWGTADALASLKGHINDRFILCNGDDIYGEDAFRQCKEYIEKGCGKNIAIGYKLIELLPDTGTVNRGVFTVDGNKITKIREWIGISRETSEKLDGLYGSVNFMCLEPKVVDYISDMNDKFKERNKENKTIEHLLPEAISELIEKGIIEMEIIISTGNCIGITRKDDIEYVKRVCMKSVYEECV